MLGKELYNNLIVYMQPKYAMSTLRKRAIFLKTIFKKYKVLNTKTLKQMMSKFKYQHQRAAIVMINNYCYDSDIPFNIRVPSIKGQSKKLPDILNPDEIKLMIDSAPKPYNLVIRCLFNIGAGLRISEIIKMKWNDIRWLDWIKDKNSYGVAIIKSGKGSKDRIVNIPKKLMIDLYDYAKEQDLLNEFKIPFGGMMFPFGSDESNKLYKKDLMKINMERWKEDYLRSRYDWFRYNILKKCCEKALNKKIKVHQLRHSRATYLHEVEKVPIEDLRLLLGHSSLNTTMIYTRINPRRVFDNLKETKEI